MLPAWLMQLATVMAGLDSNHLYMVASFNNDGYNANTAIQHNPAHSYSRDWDNYGTGRVKQLGSGNHHTEVNNCTVPCIIPCPRGPRFMLIVETST